MSPYPAIVFCSYCTLSYTEPWGFYNMAIKLKVTGSDSVESGQKTF